MLTLNEWMDKFAPACLWWRNGPTEKSKEIYPYFLVDLMAAWEKSCYGGAREVLDELLRRERTNTDAVIFSGEVHSMYEYPRGMEVISVSDTGEMRNGYSRRWEEGVFMLFGRQCHEVIWHRHDGYGREAGSIEVFVYGKNS